jgi:DNA-binding CsgD family transcriptional regulator
MLGRLIESLGTTSFEHDFHYLASNLLVKDLYHVSLVKYNIRYGSMEISSVESVFSTSRQREHTPYEAQLALNLYMTDECWKYDPITKNILTITDKILVKTPGQTKIPTRYGELIKKIMGEECSIIFKHMHESYSLTFYKHTHTKPFCSEELNITMLASDFIIPTLFKHVELRSHPEGGCQYLLLKNLEEKLIKNRIKLSHQEKKVCAKLLLGYTAKEIASALFLKEGSVRTYIDRSISKIGLNRKSDLILWTTRDE